MILVIGMTCVLISLQSIALMVSIISMEMAFMETCTILLIIHGILVGTTIGITVGIMVLTLGEIMDGIHGEIWVGAMV
jgi:hypothetical protein